MLSPRPSPSRRCGKSVNDGEGLLAVLGVRAGVAGGSFGAEDHGNMNGARVAAAGPAGAVPLARVEVPLPCRSAPLLASSRAIPLGLRRRRLRRLDGSLSKGAVCASDMRAPPDRCLCGLSAKLDSSVAREFRAGKGRTSSVLRPDLILRPIAACPFPQRAKSASGARRWTRTGSVVGRIISAAGAGIAGLEARVVELVRLHRHPTERDMWPPEFEVLVQRHQVIKNIAITVPQVGLRRRLLKVAQVPPSGTPDRSPVPSCRRWPFHRMPPVQNMATFLPSCPRLLLDESETAERHVAGDRAGEGAAMVSNELRVSMMVSGSLINSFQSSGASGAAPLQRGGFQGLEDVLLHLNLELAEVGGRRATTSGRALARSRRTDARASRPAWRGWARTGCRSRLPATRMVP